MGPDRRLIRDRAARRPVGPDRRVWARALVEANRGLDPLDLVAAVVAASAAAVARTGAADRELLGLSGPDLPADLTPPGGWADPWLPGSVHEQAVSAADRTARGAWYTPEEVVTGLVELALGPGDSADGPIGPGAFVVDPTCGGGAFLLAALDRMEAAGSSTTEAVGSVAGRDIDPGAVRVSGWAVRLWAAIRGVVLEDGAIDVAVGDALDGPAPHWPDVRAVVGNPPFATPLRSGALDERAARFRAEHQDLLGPYADVAAMHLLAAVDGAAPGSVVALIQPQSVLAGRDTAALRDHFDREAPLQALWAVREPVFDAGVRACAVVLAPGGAPPSRIRLAAGPAVDPVSPVEDGRDPADGQVPSWSGLAARALGAPVLPPALSLVGPAASGQGRLGDLIEATAGFRDEYYGLVDACREWGDDETPAPNRLLTVGAVEPLSTRWGSEPSTLGRRRWLRPTVDLDVLPPKVRAWTDRQLTPKVVLATQSRVLEPVVDRAGLLIPGTPLVAVHGAPSDLDRVAAVLLAPPVVAWAWQRWFGSALAVDALKLAARQVAELPLPVDRGAWDEATAMIAALGDQIDRRPSDGWAAAVEVAEVMTRAYRADPAVTDWWLGRARRGVAAGTSAAAVSPDG
ncbi:MAG: N-6 DNA methylase [Actinomycetota bacterium]